MKDDRFDTVNISIRLALTLGAALGGLSWVQSSFGASPENQYGEAPESLDYPEGTLETNANQYGAASESFFFPAEEDPFPQDLKIEPIDPISGKKYQKTLVGPAFKMRSKRAPFDYYRFVTMFNVNKKKDRIYDLPVHHQECHDQSDIFAAYSYSYSVSTEVSCGIDIELIGLNASISTSETRTYTMNRNLRATEWVEADHTPYFIKNNWDGYTFIQTLDSKTGKIDYIRQTEKRTSTLHNFFFPFTARIGYPIEFAVRNVDWSFIVERSVIKQCKTGTSKPPRR